VRYELFIGLRYLRAKRREAFISLITIISTLGIAIGVMTLNITLAIMTGFEEDLRDRILGFNAHVSIWSYLGPLQNPDDVAAKVRAVPGVTTAEPFVYGQLMLTTPEHFAGVLVRGIPPSMAANPDLATRLRSGSIDQLDRRFAVPLQEGRGPTVELPGIIVGDELATKLGVHPGDPISVASAGSGSGVPRIRNFVVVGEFDSGMPDYDAGLAYVSLGDAQRLYEMGDGVTGIEVKVADLYQANHIARQIERALGSGTGARLDGGEPQPVLGADAAEDGVLHRPAADHSRGRVHRAGHADHGGDGEAQGHRDPEVDGRAARRHRPRLHLQGSGDRHAGHADRQLGRLRRLLAAAALPFHRAAEGRVLRLDGAGDRLSAVFRRRHRRGAGDLSAGHALSGETSGASRAGG
jgi:hypothetical protein